MTDAFPCNLQLALAIKENGATCQHLKCHPESGEYVSNYTLGFASLVIKYELKNTTERDKSLTKAQTNVKIN